MGHVARCIPLISTFLENGNTVFAAVSEEQGNVLCAYFPSIVLVNHDGYPFVFHGKGNFSLDLARQFKRLNKRLLDEQKQTEQMVNELGIDVVISDHRYGFRSTHVTSILLTHQLNLPVRWYEGWVQKMHEKFLRNFDEIWIPDTQDSSLAGDLSRNTKEFNCSYIGALSRFQLNAVPAVKTIDTVIIASGPTIYAEQFIREQTKNSQDSGNVLLIAAPDVLMNFSDLTIPVLSSSDWKRCDAQIRKAKKVNSRCGYSTLMDLLVLKVPFSLTPTPGQREQEYLYRFWASKL